MKWLSHNHHRRFRYLPVRMQSPRAVPSVFSDDTRFIPWLGLALIREVNEHATIDFADTPDDATTTDFSESEELRISK